MVNLILRERKLTRNSQHLQLRPVILGKAILFKILFSQFNHKSPNMRLRDHNLVHRIWVELPQLNQMLVQQDLWHLLSQWCLSPSKRITLCSPMLLLMLLEVSLNQWLLCLSLILHHQITKWKDQLQILALILHLHKDHQRWEDLVNQTLLLQDLLLVKVHLRSTTLLLKNSHLHQWWAEINHHLNNLLWAVLHPNLMHLQWHHQRVLVLDPWLPHLALPKLKCKKLFKSILRNLLTLMHNYSNSTSKLRKTPS